MSFFSRKSTLSLSNFIAITVALSMGLVGCSQSELDTDHELSFDDEAEETVLLKGDPVEEEVLLKGDPESSVIVFTGQIPSLGTLETQGGIQVEGTISAQENNTDSPDTASNDIYDDDGNETPDGSEKDCDDHPEDGGLELSFSAPSAVFVGDDLTDAIKVSLRNDGHVDVPKVAVSVRLSSDKTLDDGDLELSEAGLVVSGPSALSDVMIELGKLQPLVGLESGKYVLIIHAQQIETRSGCIIDDSIASLPLEII
jgi:hypothetical protein